MSVHDLVRDLDTHVDATYAIYPAAGLPIESVAGREGGYRLSAESPVDPLMMDAGDV